jgi:hypothetical protein
MIRRHGAVVVVALAATAAMTREFKEWSAMLRPLDGSTVSGTATASPRTGDTLEVKIRIKGGAVGESLPWHLHSGGCDSSGAVLGDPARYQPVRITPEGKGEASAHVQIRLALGVAYSINVHRSASDVKVIACGNLRPIAGSMTREGR